MRRREERKRKREEEKASSEAKAKKETAAEGVSEPAKKRMAQESKQETSVDRAEPDAEKAEAEVEHAQGASNGDVAMKPEDAADKVQRQCTGSCSRESFTCKALAAGCLSLTKAKNVMDGHRPMMRT